MEKNQKYIVRADRAGVFFGEIVSRNGSEVEMANVRRLWYWDGAASLSQLAKSPRSSDTWQKWRVVVARCARI